LILERKKVLIKGFMADLGESVREVHIDFAYGVKLHMV